MEKAYMHQFHEKEIYHLLGYLINPQAFTQTLKQEESKCFEIEKFAKLFLDGCTLYTHTKFDNIISSPPFKILYMIFKNECYESFLENQEKTSSNSEKYKDAIEEIESKIQLNKI